MKNLWRICKYALIGAGISMISFLLISFVLKVSSDNLLRLALLSFGVGIISGGLVIINDYFNPIIFTIIHFVITFILTCLALVLADIGFRGISYFYLFEIVLTIYVIYTVFQYIKDVINGNKINEKLGIENEKEKTKEFLAKAFIICGISWNFLPDLFISIISSILVFIGLIILIKQSSKSKYSLCTIVVTSISLLINIFLLLASMKIESSGGKMRIGIFNGTLVSIINLIFNLVIIIVAIISLLSKKQNNKTEY